MVLWNLFRKQLASQFLYQIEFNIVIYTQWVVHSQAPAILKIDAIKNGLCFQYFIEHWCCYSVGLINFANSTGSSVIARRVLKNKTLWASLV